MQAWTGSSKDQQRRFVNGGRGRTQHSLNQTSCQVYDVEKHTFQDAATTRLLFWDGFGQEGATVGHCRYLSEALTAPESTGGPATFSPSPSPPLANSSPNSTSTLLANDTCDGHWWRVCKTLLMDEDDDDVFGAVSHCWPSSSTGIKQEDQSTQTPGSQVARINGMLPCGVDEEPRRLFYGSAGLLLLTSSARSDHIENAMLPENQPRRRQAHSVEVQIGQKLQMIGDQFYQEHMLQHRNQRNQWPFWLRLASALYAILFEGEPAVHRRRPEDRSVEVLDNVI
ncbi:bcl-2-modifying factor [Silurus meridionalis]|nr:bcl-2-modifying factor [Silurus meridionalis]